MDRETLEGMLSEGCSLEEIGRRVDRHPSTVSYWLDKHGLEPVMCERHAAKGGLSREVLEPLVERGLTVRQIAAEVELSPTAVRHWLQRYELRTQRAREPRGGSVQDRFVAVCRVHGETEFQLRADGGRRCLRCRCEAVTRRRREVKAILVADAGGRCAACGFDGYVGALEFHHLDPGQKAFALSHEGVTRSLQRARAEAEKCVLLCANCHAAVEGGVLALDDRLAASGAASPG